MKMGYFNFLFVFIVMLFLNVNICYAMEEYIGTEVVIDDDNIKLNITSGNDFDMYGFLGTIDYDSDKLRFNGCKSDLFDVSVENNILLLEGIKGYSGTTIAVCDFYIIEDSDTFVVGVKDISLSDGIKVIYNNDSDVKVEFMPEEDKENTIEKNPTTYGYFIVIAFVIVVIALATIIIISKKYSLLSYLIIFTIIVSPAISYAIDLEEQVITEEELDEIRNILLEKQDDDTNNKYDFDNDNKLTINDLILGLINFNTFEEEGNDDDNTDIPIVQEKYKVKISYSVNDGIISSVTSGGNWTTSNGLIYQDGNLYQTTINYGESTNSDGVVNYNNSDWVNIKKQGHYAVSGKEWKCLSGCEGNKTFDQTKVYKAADFCDASKGDCTVILGVNWKPNVVTIKYSANGGIPTALTDGGKWTIDDNNLIYKNGNLLTNVINYGDKLSSTYGLQNYNNKNNLYITRTGYSVLEDAEWICLSGCIVNNKTFNQTSAYSDLEFCDASNGDCSVIVGVNWTANVYNINLDNQGATTTGSDKIYLKYESGIYLDSGLSNKMSTSANNITVPKKTGYTFGGYYTDANGTGTQMISSSGYITSNFTTTKYTSNTTLYAKWTKNAVSIRYNTNGGEIASSSNSAGTWTKDNTGLVYLNNNILENVIEYGASLGGDGLNNWNNSNFLNILRKNYTASSGAEWKCLSGCTTNGKTYDHTKIYNASDFCDASNSNCSVVLGVNWISNDDTAPVISSCSAIIKDNKTTFNITTSDTDIVKYVVNDNNSMSFTDKNHTISSVIESPKITAYDSSNNSSSVNCSWYYEQIGPKGTENTIHYDSTDTLKVWIELNDRTSRTDYYTTHIWVKDAYRQFKSQVPDNFGKELKTANVLMGNAVRDYGLENKLAVGINASGFVRNGYFGQYMYDANPKFDMTSGSPIVIVNGVVKRDLASETLPDPLYTVYGLNKNGMLSHYNYTGGLNVEKNTAVSNKIKNDGVLNTFAFSPVLVYSGILMNNDTAQNIRQGICQIDKNNFVFITDIYNESSARDGFSMQELGNYMISLGCKVGFNLDGGGSTSLIYKEPDKSSTTVISNPPRSIADIVFFHE